MIIGWFELSKSVKEIEGGAFHPSWLGSLASPVQKVLSFLFPGVRSWTRILYRRPDNVRELCDQRFPCSHTECVMFEKHLRGTRCGNEILESVHYSRCHNSANTFSEQCSGFHKPCGCHMWPCITP